MAQYDGSIRINIQIDSKNASAQLMTLENRIVKTADKIASLRSKMDVLKDAKIPTQEYTAAQKEVDKYSAFLQKTKEKIDKLLETGVDQKSSRFISAQYDVANLENKLLDAEEVVKRLEQEGKAFTLGSNTEEYAKLSQQLKYAENEMETLNQKHEVQSLKVEKAENEYKKLGSVAGNSLKRIGSIVKESAISSMQKLSSVAKKVGSSIKSIASKLFSIGKSAKSSSGSLNGGLKSILKYGLGIRSLYALFNKLRTAIKEGFSSLYNDPNMESFKNTVDSLKASLLTLKNSFAAAFKPLVEVAIPYIQKAIEYITRFADSFGQLTAAITGQKSYTKVIKQTTAAIEDENKAQNRQLSSLDKLNNLSSESGGTDGGASTQMFEEIPVDNKFIEMASKTKEVLSQIFQPLKTTWENQGKFVMDSWKYALEEIDLLAKSVGSDFIAVWNQPTTISVLENMLIIIGDIGLIVGNLANRLKEAWETNDIGLHILENIRDIFATIIEHIRNAADYTVEWSKKLDFAPLLESINGLLEALKPLTDNIGANLEWFWNNVLLPIAGWTIEDAIPVFLDMLSAAIGTVNEVIEALKPLGTWLWQNFLQPLGEWAGKTIISAMQTITDLLSKFGDWISKHQGVIETLTIIIGSFAAAWGVVAAAVTAWNVVAGIAAGVTTALGAAVAFLTSPIGLTILAIGALIAIGILLYKNWDVVKEKVLGIWNKIKSSLLIALNIIKTTWNMAWTGMKNTVISIFNSIWSGIKGVINKILNGIEGMANGVIRGINFVIGVLNGISFDIPDWLKYVPGMSGIAGKTFGFNIPELSQVSIPRLATGAVIPANKEFLAVLGDQQHGTNIEAPLDTIKQANEEAILNVFSKLGISTGNNRNSGNETFVFQVDGRTFFEITRKYANEYSARTGRSPFSI